MAETTELRNQIPPYMKAVSGSLGGVVEACCLQPIDVLKTRLQLDRVGAYKGIGHCGTTVVQTEGVRALWKGLTPFATHLTLKYTLRMGSNALFQTAFKDSETGKVSNRGRFLSGFGAGVLEALAIVTPFEVKGAIKIYPMSSLLVCKSCLDRNLLLLWGVVVEETISRFDICVDISNGLCSRHVVLIKTERNVVMAVLSVGFVSAGSRIRSCDQCSSTACRQYIFVMVTTLFQYGVLYFGASRVGKRMSSSFVFTSHLFIRVLMVSVGTKCTAGRTGVFGIGTRIVYLASVFNYSVWSDV